ncbi:MAG: methylamine utilization protein [Halopseudomonas sp.]|uniref:methylamine utilization protein n=1 Tax=Halopseudomonas sp. TaxID=2901191 RepID=UPI003001D945
MLPYLGKSGALRCTLLAGLFAAGPLLLAGPSVGAEVILTDAAGAPLANAVLLVDAVPAAPQQMYVMDQVERQFLPQVLTVPVGALVDFPNSDDVRHHVYSFSDAKPFELRLFKGSEAPPVTFDRAGAVVLGCNIHDAMVGYILVTESPQFAVSDASGRVSLPDLPDGNWPVSWWHPSQFQQAPVSLGELDLSTPGQTLSLPVTAAPAEPAPALSPLQQRFKTGY